MDLFGFSLQYIERCHVMNDYDKQSGFRPISCYFPNESQTLLRYKESCGGSSYLTFWNRFKLLFKFNPNN